MTELEPPTLYIFSISHYCEKARWALDYAGLDYRIKFLPPGPHIAMLKKLGTERSSVPVLQAGTQLIQGSTAIVDWVVSQASDKGKQLQPDADQSLTKEIEARVNKIAGVQLRRYFYSEAIIDQPQMIKSIFTSQLSLIDRLKIYLAWGKICRGMIRHMDLGPAQGIESMAILATELDWLDSLLADGRKFFVGNRFSRVDIAVASLLSPILLPPEHPVYNSLRLPPKMALQVKDWETRPSLTWLRETYRGYRQA
ncbi:MAG: glutathione S-transferase [Planctomycetota bacterium]|jgi:glutathione S-transferase